MEFGSVADLNKEILIEVHPDMTNADDDIRLIEHVWQFEITNFKTSLAVPNVHYYNLFVLRNYLQDKRKCYFGSEKKLKFFGPYTGGFSKL